MRRVLWSVLLAVATLVVFTSPAWAYLYRAQVSIVENGTANYTPMLGVSWNSSNTWMAANGFFTTASGMDTRVQTLGGLNKPRMLTTNQTFTAVPVAANTQTNLYFVTGETAASDMDIIPGYGGYVTTTDNASLELGSNYTVSMGGVYLDTTIGANKYTMRKTNSLYLTTGNTTSGNVTAILVGATGLATNITPDGAGDFTNIASVVGAPTHWQAVLTDDGAASFVQNASFVQQKDAYTMTDGSVNALAVIDSVNVGARWWGNGGDARCAVLVRLAGAETISGDDTGAGVYKIFTAALARPGGGSWTVADIPNIQAGVGIWNIAGATVNVTQVWTQINYHFNDTALPLYGVSSGAYDVAVTEGGGNLTLTVGSSTNSTAVGHGVVDTANDYRWLESAAYADNITLDNGVVRLNYNPNTMISGNILPNRAVASTDVGQFTWGTNPTGVSVTMGSMTSSGQPSVGGTTSTPTTNLLPVAGGADWNRTPDVSGTLLTNPLRPLVTLVSDNSTLTERQAWVWGGIMFVAFVLVLAAKHVRGHQGITAVATGAAIVACVVQTIFPLWALVLAIPAIIGGILSERTPSV